MCIPINYSTIIINVAVSYKNKQLVALISAVKPLQKKRVHQNNVIKRVSVKQMVTTTVCRKDDGHVWQIS